MNKTIRYYILYVILLSPIIYVSGQVPQSDISITGTFKDYTGILTTGVGRMKCDSCFFKGFIELQNNTDEYLVFHKWQGYDLVIDSCLKIQEDIETYGMPSTTLLNYTCYLAPHKKGVLSVNYFNFCSFENNCIQEETNNNADKIVFRFKCTYQKMKKISKDSLPIGVNIFTVKSPDLIFCIGKTTHTYVSDLLVWENTDIDNYSGACIEEHQIENIVLPQKINHIAISGEQYGINKSSMSWLRVGRDTEASIHEYILTGVIKITNTGRKPVIIKDVTVIYPDDKERCRLKINSINYERNLCLSPGKSCFVAYELLFSINIKDIPRDMIFNNEYLINNFAKKAELILQFGTNNIPVKYKNKEERKASFFKSDKKIRNIKTPLDIQSFYIDEYSKEGVLTILEK
jgi:hypothetical protein